MSQNIFYKVINSENQISQLLVNLVNENAEIKKIVTDFFFTDKRKLELFNSEYLLIDTFNTQKRDEYGQPDIQFTIRNIAKEFIGEAIVEVKTRDSQLTDKQPKGYAEKLLQTNKGKKCLFFLIPKYYHHEKAIIDKLNELKLEDIDFDVFYWNDLVTELVKNLGSFQSDLVIEIIAHMNDKFGYSNIKFDLQQIDDIKKIAIPKFLFELNGLIDAIAKTLNAREFKWYNYLDQGGGSYGQGYGFSYESHLFWFGSDFELWKNKGAILSIFIDRNSPSYSLFDTYFKERVQEIDPNSKYVDLTEEILRRDNVQFISELILNFINESDKSNGVI